MKIAKKIEIIGSKRNFWYYWLIGCTFDVVKEYKENYEIIVGGVREKYVRKEHTKVIEWIKPSYRERQAEWIKENDIKVGDRVRVINSSKHEFEDSPDKIYEVSEININFMGTPTTYIGIKDVPVLFPLSMIELVENVYQPCETVEEKLLFIGRKVRRKSDGARVGMITGIYDDGFRLGSKGIIYADSRDLLEGYELLDGSPIGVEKSKEIRK